MKYNVVVKKGFRYIRTYTILKRANDNTNAASKFVQRMIDKYVSKKQD